MNSRRARPLALALLLATIGFGADCPGLPDDYVAPWPQDTAEPGGYDEAGATGPLRAKADGFDAWHPAWHQPYYGGRAAVRFTDLTRTEVAEYIGWGDSTFFSGIYLASQAMRYHVTGSADARANVVRVANALSGHLHVTGAPGYIARYRAPQDSIIYQGDAWCAEQDRCFAVEDGPYAGDFWWGSTSRDQYIGWMFGMTMAYELVDDEPMRAMIRADVLEVLTMLLDNGWIIIDQDGNPTGTAPVVLPMTQLSFAVQAYHVTGDERILEALRGLLLDKNRPLYTVSAFNLFNRYDQYFGNNLAHIQMFQLLRLGARYFSPEDHAWLVGHFNDDVHTFTRLSHNAWFNSVYMSQGGWEPGEGGSDPYLGQLVQDLTDFSSAPNTRYALPDRDPETYEIDPLSQTLVQLEEQFPELVDLIGIDFKLQALEAFPVRQQCSDHYLWERNPFKIEACGFDEPREAGPGADYLIAYWTSAYHRVLDKSD